MSATKEYERGDHLPNLSSRLSATVLPILEVARIQIGANDALVKLGARDVAERREGVVVLEVSLSGEGCDEGTTRLKEASEQKGISERSAA